MREEHYQEDGWVSADPELGSLDVCAVRNRTGNMDPQVKLMRWTNARASCPVRSRRSQDILREGLVEVVPRSPFRQDVKEVSQAIVQDVSSYQEALIRDEPTFTASVDEAAAGDSTQQASPWGPKGLLEGQGQDWQRPWCPNQAGRQDGGDLPCRDSSSGPQVSMGLTRHRFRSGTGCVSWGGHG